MTTAVPAAIPRRTLPSGADLLDLIFRRAGVLVSCFVVVTGIALAYLLVKPRQFRSEALLLLRHDRAQAVISPGQSNPVVGPITENDLRTESELLQSRDLLEKAVVASGIATGPQVDMDNVIRDVRRYLRVTPVLKADMIRVEYISPVRDQGQRLLKELLRVYRDRHIALRGSSGAKLFEDEAKRLGAELKDKERQLAKFQGTADIYVMAEQKALLLRKLMDAEAALREAQVRRADSFQRARDLEAQVGRMPRRLTTQVRKLPNQYSAERLRTMLVELENRRVELLGKFRDDDRLVKQNADQIAVTRKALAEVIGSSAVEEASDLNSNRQSLENEMARSRVDASAAEAREKLLQRHLEGYRAELARLESVTVEFDQLTREVRELTERYQLHSRKAEEARIEAALDERRVTNLAVVQEPTAPTRPEGRPVAAALGIWMLGSLAAFGGVLVFSAARNVFYTAESLENFTGLPVLGTVALRKRVN